jgi:hypothetical protein
MYGIIKEGVKLLRNSNVAKTISPIMPQEFTFVVPFKIFLEGNPAVPRSIWFTDFSFERLGEQAKITCARH